jgi:hypothetical protein
MLSLPSIWKTLRMKPKKRIHTSITGKTLFGTDTEFHLTHEEARRR